MAKTKAPVTVSPEQSRSLKRLNLGIGLAHLVQAITMFALSNDLAIPITADFLDNDPVAVLQGGGQVDPTTVFELPVGPAVAVFLLLAAIDHLLSAGPLQSRYDNQLRQGRNDLRWTEYSISAPTDSRNSVTCSLALSTLSTSQWSEPDSTLVTSRLRTTVTKCTLASRASARRTASSAACFDGAPPSIPTTIVFMMLSPRVGAQ